MFFRGLLCEQSSCFSCELTHVSSLAILRPWNRGLALDSVWEEHDLCLCMWFEVVWGESSGCATLWCLVAGQAFLTLVLRAGIQDFSEPASELASDGVSSASSGGVGVAFFLIFVGLPDRLLLPALTLMVACGCA